MCDVCVGFISLLDSLPSDRENWFSITYTEIKKMIFDVTSELILNTDWTGDDCWIKYTSICLFFFCFLIGWLVGTINHIHKLIQYNNNWIRRYSFVVYACVWECGWWGISGLWPSVILQFHYLIDISPAAFLHPLSLLPTKHRRDLIVILICETH